jgi:hypothetical protein
VFAWWYVHVFLPEVLPLAYVNTGLGESDRDMGARGKSGVMIHGCRAFCHWHPGAMDVWSGVLAASWFER